MKKVLLTSAVVLAAFGAYNSANAQDVTVPSVTANTSTYVQTLKQKIELVRSGYYYYKANGTQVLEPGDAAKADALADKVNAVQQAINELTQRQNEYKTVYARYHEALTERQAREAKLEELAAAVKTASDKLTTLLVDSQAYYNVNVTLRTERDTLEGTGAGSVAAAETDVVAKEAILVNARKTLADYKANHATKFDFNASGVNQYDQQVKQLTDAVTSAESDYNDAKTVLATRSARLDQVYAEIDQAMDVDYATKYAIHQAQKELRVARKAQSENDGKLTAAKKLVDGDPVTGRVGLKAELDALTGTGAGSIAAAKSTLNAAIGAANAEFASIDPAKAKALGLTFELDKIKAAVEEVVAQNPVKPAEKPAEKPAAQAAWVQSGSRWWYKHADGSYTTNGWEKINGTWYYFDQAGWMATGWVKDNGTWYYLKDNGAMATGWVKDNGTWYYLKDNGAMATGWYKVADKWYYSYASGALAVNTTVDGYTVNGNGEWV